MNRLEDDVAQNVQGVGDPVWKTRSELQLRVRQDSQELNSNVEKMSQLGRTVKPPWKMTQSPEGKAGA